MIDSECAHRCFFLLLFFPLGLTRVFSASELLRRGTVELLREFFFHVAPTPPQRSMIRRVRLRELGAQQRVMAVDTNENKTVASGEAAAAKTSVNGGRPSESVTMRSSSRKRASPHDEIVITPIDSAVDAEAGENSGNGRTLIDLVIESCVTTGGIGAIDALLRAGVDINQADTNGDTAMHVAGVYDVPGDVVGFLIERGGNVNKANRRGITPFHLACNNRTKKQVLDVFIGPGCADLDALDASGASPAHYAARSTSANAMYALIHAGADVNQRDTFGLSPAHRAAGNTNGEVIRALIAAHSNVNCVSSGDDTPLLVAAKNENSWVLAAVIEAGGNVSSTNSSGQSPLHLAVDNTLSVLLLIAAGACVNAVDKVGNTPLHCAVIQRAAGSIALLIAAAADSTGTNESGMTARELARNVYWLDEFDTAVAAAASMRWQQFDFLHIERALERVRTVRHRFGELGDVLATICHTNFVDAVPFFDSCERSDDDSCEASEESVEVDLLADLCEANENSDIGAAHLLTHCNAFELADSQFREVQSRLRVSDVLDNAVIAARNDTRQRALGAAATLRDVYSSAPRRVILDALQRLSRARSIVEQLRRKFDDNGGDVPFATWLADKQAVASSYRSITEMAALALRNALDMFSRTLLAAAGTQAVAPLVKNFLQTKALARMLSQAAP